MDIKVKELAAISISKPQNVPPVERLIQSRQEAEAAKTAEAKAQTRTPSEADLKKSVDDVNQVLESLNHSLRFQVDQDTDRVQVQVVDASSDKVLKEIPADSVLELSSKIKEMADMFGKMVGVLVDEFI